MMNDLLSDAITRIRNGFMRGIKEVSILKSKVNNTVIDLLIAEGYLLSKEEGPTNIKVRLHYDKDNKPAMVYIKRISKTGKRIYASCNQYRRINNYSLLILSTNRGILTHVDAYKQSLGGEVLLEIF